MQNTNKYLNDLFGLKGKRIMVTGAIGQLGKIICQGFIDAGAIVIGVDLYINQKRIINNENIHYYLIDITSKDSVQKTFSEVYYKDLSSDILINNAGVSTFE